MFSKPFRHKIGASKDNHGPELLLAPRYVFNLENISSSLKSDDKKKSYARKTDLEPLNSFDSIGRPDSHPPILLFEASLIN